MTSTTVDVGDAIDARVLLGVLAQVNERGYSAVLTCQPDIDIVLMEIMMPIMGRSIL